MVHQAWKRCHTDEAHSARLFQPFERVILFLLKNTERERERKARRQSRARMLPVDVSPPDECIQIQLHPLQLLDHLISVAVSFLPTADFSLSFRCSVFIIPMNICST